MLNKSVGALLSFLKELLNNKVCEEKYITDLQNQFNGLSIEEELLSQFTPQFSSYLNLNLHKLSKKHCIKLYQLSKISFERSKLYGVNNKVNTTF